MHRNMNHNNYYAPTVTTRPPRLVSLSQTGSISQVQSVNLLAATITVIRDCYKFFVFQVGYNLEEMGRFKKSEVC